MGLIRELMFFGLAVLRGMLILVIYVCLSSDSQHLAGGTHCVDFKWVSGDHLQAGAGSWWKIL